MNEKLIIILVASALIVGGCGKQSTANNNNGQPLPPVQAEPFHGQVYKSVDGRNVVTLTSKDECELTQGGTTLLCKYTKQTDALRVIATVMGTPQVLYFRFVDQGLQANDGQVLLAPRQYADAIAQLEKQRREQEQQQAKEQMERERIAKEIADSIIATRTISTFTLPPEKTLVNGESGSEPTRTLTLTDVSWKMDAHDRGNNFHDEIRFSQIRKIHDVGEGEFRTFYNHGFSVSKNEFFIECEPIMVTTHGDQVINGGSPVEAQTIRDAMMNAYNAWKTKFPDAVLK